MEIWSVEKHLRLFHGLAPIYAYSGVEVLRGAFSKLVEALP